MADNQEKKPIYKKAWFWIIIVLVVIVITGSGSNNNSNNPTVTTSSTDSSQTEDNSTEATSGNTTVHIGEEVSTNDTKITFISANDYTNYSQYSPPKDGNKIIRAEFAFENISNSDIFLSNLDCYADGEKVESYYSADDYKNPTLEKLSSGKKLTAVVYYEVPANAQNIVIEYETSAWTSNKIEFVVQ